MSKKQYCYSTNEETFNGIFDSVGEAIKQAFDDNPDSEQLFIGQIANIKSVDLINVYSLIENIQQQAGDIAGEASEVYLEDLLKNKEKIAEIENLIATWLDTNYPINFYSVDNIQTVYRNYDGPGAVCVNE